MQSTRDRDRSASARADLSTIPGESASGSPATASGDSPEAHPESPQEGVPENPLDNCADEVYTGARARLGIYGKSHSALIQINDLGKVDLETGEVLDSPVYDPIGARLERFALQSVVRSILPRSSTAKCLRCRQAHRETIDVLRSIEHGSTAYSGLQTCGSTWNCPVCAAKISERRRVELQEAIALWTAQGGSVLLLTLTHPHTRADRLEALLEAERRAIKLFFGCRQGLRLMAALGRRGQVKALEVTHGRNRVISNGWHPHFHILLFLDGQHPDLLGLEDQVYRVWLNACRRSGLDAPSRVHGVRLDGGAKAAAYVAKMGLEVPRGPWAGGWSLGHELTKGHTKKAGDGETPFDLLRSQLACDDPEGRALFLEFAHAMKGRRQLVWSRGLRDLLGLDAPGTDEEVAAQQEDDAEILGRLTVEQWRMVLRFDLRGELLELARHGWAPVERMLAGFAGRTTEA